MRHFFVQLVRCLLFISIPACLFLLNYKYSSGISYLNHNSKPAPSLPPDKIHETSHNRRGPVKLVVVTCGKRLNGTLVNIKSAAAFTRAPLHLLLFADAANMKPLREEISEWPSSVLERVTYDVRQVNFPEDPKGKWKNLFQLCASQRLFLPSMLPKEDAVLYVDSDVLFLHPVENLWNLFGAMDGMQLAGLSQESEDYATNWYHRFARHPYVEPLGVNSGVMLMNLTRMRDFGWESAMRHGLSKYERNISWGDQDLINIVFHDNPKKLLMFPCRWNFRTDHCVYGPACLGATVAILHGNRGAFNGSNEPAFKATYRAMEDYLLGTSLVKNFINPLEVSLRQARVTRCGQELLKHLVQWRELARQLDAQN